VAARLRRDAMQHINMQHIKMQHVKMQHVKMQHVKMQHIKMQHIKMQHVKIQPIKRDRVPERVAARLRRIAYDAPRTTCAMQAYKAPYKTFPNEPPPVGLRNGARDAACNAATAEHTTCNATEVRRAARS
jgi:hypothetical protein